MAIYDTMALTIHRKCNARCTMCCFSSSPHNTENLSMDLVERLINESANCKQIKSIAITGGEPFIDYEKVLYIFEKIKEAKNVVA